MGSNDASSSPEFFFHHGFLDNIWYRWQLKGHKCKYAYYPKENSKLVGSRYRAMDFLDSHDQGECVRVKYDDFIAKKIQSGLKIGKLLKSHFYPGPFAGRQLLKLQFYHVSFKKLCYISCNRIF